MLIEKQEELKSWLTSHLEPLCDADPAALAKYVLALIKKDKTVDELKESMVSQMDVFLQNETKSFVEMLFTAVDTKEYIGSAVIKDDNGHEAPKEEAVVKEPEVEADSTTPIREPERPELKDPRGFPDERRRARASPPRDSRRLASRLGPRSGGGREPRGRGFRSRSRSLSPRHDRFRSSRDARRRSRSPLLPPRRAPSPRRPRSLDRPAGGRDSRDSTPTRDEAAGYTPSAKRPRCRDYDEKGFCLRGDLCKFDHGVDAVVLEDAGKPPVAGYTPGAPPPGEPYIPGLPGPLGVMSIPPPGYAPGIISVPPPGYLPQYGKRPHDGGMVEPAAKRFDFHRLGGARGRGRGRGRGGRGGAASSMLAVRNIPPELNTITHLNGHFSRYGNLINVQVQFEGDPGSALVTYGNGDEANSAFSTSEAVMNNRFIKVFWHKDMGSLKDRLGNPNMGDKLTRTITNDGETTGEAEGEDSPEKAKERKEKQIEAIQENQKMMQMKHELLKKADEKRKEALVQQEGLIKSKQTLMEGLIEQQKMLIMKLEKGKGTIKVEEKSKIMKLLKELSASIDRNKEDIKMSLSMVKSKTRSELQKELLDAEMELFTKQQDDEDTAEIQAKVNSLRLEAARSGVLPTSRGRGRGRGYRGRGSPRGGGFMRGRGGRGRGFTLSPGGQCVDRRPSRILVSGYELEEKDELVVHFAKFGEILEQVEDEVTPSVILKFKTRRFAESAMATGRNYKDRTLSLSWYSQATPGLGAGGEQFPDEGAEEADDGYTPPQEDYLPPGLQEHEDILSQASQEEKDELADGAEELNDTAEGAEELNEDLLDDEEEEDDEKSWKRRNNEDD